ncbi:MAG: hypothetical protein WD336_01380 [Trueperaceae bacterium]
MRTSRRWEPVPRFYATLGAIALAPAALAAWLAPRRRWLALIGLPATAMVGGLVWSLTSAFDRRGRRTIARHLDPAAGIVRELADEEARIRLAAPRFVLLQPADWDGKILIGGSAFRPAHGGPEEVTEVSVTADQGPLPDRHQGLHDLRALTLRTSNEPFQFPEDNLLWELASLEREAHPDRDPPPTGGDQAEVERWFAAMRVAERRRAGQLAGRWRDVGVTVDDVPVTIRLVDGDGAAIARFDLDGQHVRIEAIGVAIDGLALRRVTDVESLLTAMRDRRSQTFVPRRPGR